MPGVGGTLFDEDDIFSPDSKEGGAPRAIELDDIRVAPTGSLAPATPVTAVGRAPRFSPVERFERSAVFREVELTAEEKEARALADYGDSPKTWWQAPLYAYRVRTRQSELRRQLAERRQDLGRAREACEEAKVAFAERARPVARKVETFARLLEPIAAAEKVMLERDGALAAEMEAHQAQLRVIDERVAQLEMELAEAKSEEDRIEAMLAEAEAVRQRAEAKMKRVEIEIRNASARVEGEGGGERVGAKGVGTPS